MLMFFFWILHIRSTLKRKYTDITYEESDKEDARIHTQEFTNESRAKMQDYRNKNQDMTRFQNITQITEKKHVCEKLPNLNLLNKYNENEFREIYEHPSTSDHRDNRYYALETPRLNNQSKTVKSNSENFASEEQMSIVPSDIVTWENITVDLRCKFLENIDIEAMRDQYLPKNKEEKSIYTQQQKKTPFLKKNYNYNEFIKELDFSYRKVREIKKFIDDSKCLNFIQNEILYTELQYIIVRVKFNHMLLCDESLETILNIYKNTFLGIFFVHESKGNTFLDACAIKKESKPIFMIFQILPLFFNHFHENCTYENVLKVAQKKNKFDTKLKINMQLNSLWQGLKIFIKNITTIYKNVIDHVNVLNTVNPNSVYSSRKIFTCLSSNLSTYNKILIYLQNIVNIYDNDFTNKLISKYIEELKAARNYSFNGFLKVLQLQTGIFLIDDDLVNMLNAKNKKNGFVECLYKAQPLEIKLENLFNQKDIALKINIKIGLFYQKFFSKKKTEKLQKNRQIKKKYLKKKNTYIYFVYNKKIYRILYKQMVMFESERYLLLITDS